MTTPASCRILIAHAEWSPGRLESYQRLLGELAGQGLLPFAFSQRSLVKEHANVWAVRLWKQALAMTRGDAFLFLNDDVTVHPELWKHVPALQELLPEDVVSLHGNFAALAGVAAQGQRLARCVWPTGPAYLVPRAVLAGLVAWVESLPPGWFAGEVNEDGVIASYLVHTKRPAYVTIPALVRHDVSVPSTLGYDHHLGRRSPIDWSAATPAWTAADVAAAPTLPVPWMTDAELEELDQVLTGRRPLCAFCVQRPGLVVHPIRKTAVCRVCARSIAAAVPRL